MIHMEDAELEKRFGDNYRAYPSHRACRSPKAILIASYNPIYN